MKRKKKQQSDAPVVENGEAVKKKSSTKTLLLIIVSCLLGVAIIITGIVLPFVLSDEYTNDESVNPYAVMKLSNGMTITYEIWENECPIAATNFIYLAEIGYFDGTVIFDNQSCWVRFGGWQSDGKHRGDENTAFLNGITGRTYGTSDYSSNKFGYRLKKDTARSDYATAGVLSFCYERSATEFQIAATSDVALTIDGDTVGDWKVAPFGMAADDDSIAAIRAIAALSSDTAGEKFSHAYYRAPLDDDGLITIKSVKVRKKLESKWRDFDFMEWMLGTDSSSRRQSWSTYKKSSGST